MPEGKVTGKTSYLVRDHFEEAVHNPVTGKVTIKTRCPICTNISEPFEVNAEDLVRWHYAKKFAQDVFPYLTIDQREQLITGMDECFPQEIDEEY